MHKRGCTTDTIEAALLAENANFNAPLPDAKVTAIAHDIPARYPNAPSVMPTPKPTEAASVVLTATGVEILDWIVGFLRRFVSLSAEQACVVALWVVHTYAMAAADCTPYLAVNSAEKQSGKTRLLEILRLLVLGAWFTARTTAAVLARKIDAVCPTLLLDESDAAFSGDETYTEVLRGVLNSGYRRGGCVSVCVGKGAEISYNDFSTFCAKAIAGIGKLPDTVADRSIPIRLMRASRGTVERFRERDAERETQVWKEQMAAWCEAHIEDLRNARPDIPNALSDRQADVCEPLLAIADAAGGKWPQAARTAMLELCVGAQAEHDASTGVNLLADIRGIFAERGAPHIPSKELVTALNEIEGHPWADWFRGRGLSPNNLARLLEKYQIYPTTIRVGGETPKGYRKEDFEDAWARYCPYIGFQTATTPQPASLLAETVFSNRNTKNDVAVQKVPQTRMDIGVLRCGVSKPEIQAEESISDASPKPDGATNRCNVAPASDDATEEGFEL
jgi:hypothetical protein